jgi:hypothetical protein
MIYLDLSQNSTDYFHNLADVSLLTQPKQGPAPPRGGKESWSTGRFRVFLFF